jgi:spore maturation protein CgeB
MKIVVFGLSITSAWGNGHATTFRALLKALHGRGHQISFFERDAEWYASNRDLPQPEFCRVHIYESWSTVREQALREAREADVVMLGSYVSEGAQIGDEILQAVSGIKAFYDIDTPITVAQLRATGEAEYLRAGQIPGFDLYFSFTGGPMLREIEQKFGSPRAVPLYCSFDPAQYRSFRVNQRFACDFSYMGTYAPDRQPKLEQLLFAPAGELPEQNCIVAGSMYPKGIKWPRNVRRIRHLNPRWHARFYCSSRFTLNVTRRDMVMAGYSPSVRLFEAAACGATIVSDSWPGLEEFLAPGREILLPAGSRDVVGYLTDFDDAERKRIGRAAQQRVLAEHTNAHRAEQFETAVAESMQSSHSMARTAS